MRYRSLLALLLLAAPAPAFGQDDARALAQDILGRGAALFDTRDAAAMAATYLDEAEGIVIKRDADSGRLTVEAVRGRGEIEKGYARIFKDRRPEHKSRNTVETARFLGPDLLLIQGRFALDREQGDAIQFVQIRAREGDQWKVVSMQLMELPK